MAYYFWHGLDFQGSRVSGAFKVPNRIDVIKKIRNKGIFRSRLLLYSRSMELQLKSGVLLNDALVQAEHLFSGSQQKKTEKGQERHNFRCFSFGSFQPPFRIS